MDMENLQAFKAIFPENSKAQQMGLTLRELILNHFTDIEESVHGGAKVKLTLYTRGGKNNVLCGIQEGKEDSCMLYVHHVESIKHERLKFSGSGKHAKRIRFTNISEIIDEDIRWLLSQVETNAPF